MEATAMTTGTGSGRSWNWSKLRSTATARKRIAWPHCSTRALRAVYSRPILFQTKLPGLTELKQRQELPRIFCFRFKSC